MTIYIVTRETCYGDNIVATFRSKRQAEYAKMLFGGTVIATRIGKFVHEQKPRGADMLACDSFPWTVEIDRTLKPYRATCKKNDAWMYVDCADKPMWWSPVRQSGAQCVVEMRVWAKSRTNALEKAAKNVRKIIKSRKWPRSYGDWLAKLRKAQENMPPPAPYPFALNEPLIPTHSFTSPQ